MSSLGGHHTELVLVDEVNKVLDLVFQRRILDILSRVWVSRLASRVGVAVGHDGGECRIDVIVGLRRKTVLWKGATAIN